MSELPKGWREEKLFSCAKPTKGKKPKILQERVADGFAPYIDIKAFEFGQIRQYAEISSSKITTPDDILMVWDGARSGLVGRGFYGAIGSTIVALKPTNVIKEYLYYFLWCKYDYINTTSQTTIRHLPQDRLVEIEIPLPPLPEQEEIFRRVNELFALADKIEQRYKTAKAQLARAEKAIYAKAFRGELVRQVEE